MGVFGSHGVLVAMFLCSGLVGAAAQEPPSLVNDLEYKIEVGRHEQLLTVQRSTASSLAPFTSDGCSGGLSSSWIMISSLFPVLAKRHGERPPWEGCCVAHDRTYHKGGVSDSDAKSSFEMRRTADDQLRACVIKVGDDRMQFLMTEYGLDADEVVWLFGSISDVMYRAVRLGGAPCTGLPWRWGFGWPPCK
jgi:hypothetical protein